MLGCWSVVIVLAIITFIALISTRDNGKSLRIDIRDKNEW